MRRLTLVSALGVLALTACSKPADKPAADTAAAVAAPPPPMAFVTVIYNQPKSTAAFEKYYWATHLPLVVQNQPEIGFVAAELTKFDGTLDGKKSPYYRQAVLWFTDMAALEKGIATPEFKAVGDNLAEFATGGLTGMVGEETGEHQAPLTGDSTTFLTVLYNAPTDAATFESYYSATHIPLVVSGASEIAFTRAELSKYAKNLDGTPPAFYRQAKLYFPSTDALKTGTGTAAFKAVGDDLPKFATGGLTALVGHVTTKE